MQYDWEPLHSEQWERFLLRKIIAYGMKAEFVRLAFKFLSNLTPSHFFKAPYVQLQRAPLWIQELVWSSLSGRRPFLLGTQGEQVEATSKEETHGQKFSPGGNWLEEHRESSPWRGDLGAGKSNLTTAQTWDQLPCYSVNRQDLVSEKRSALNCRSICITWNGAPHLTIITD